jgi:hypothetical protein
MIAHKAPGEASGVIIRAPFRHQSQIRPPIVITKENRQPPVAALRHMVGHLWDYDPSEPSHLSAIRTRLAKGNLRDLYI